MKVEVVDNTEIDPHCCAGYFRVTWTDGDWMAKVFPVSDPRLQRYLKAVERLKFDLGVYADE